MGDEEVEETKGGVLQENTEGKSQQRGKTGEFSKRMGQSLKSVQQ